MFLEWKCIFAGLYCGSARTRRRQILERLCIWQYSSIDTILSRPCTNICIIKQKMGTWVALKSDTHWLEPRPFKRHLASWNFVLQCRVLSRLEGMQQMMECSSQPYETWDLTWIGKKKWLVSICGFRELLQMRAAECLLSLAAHGKSPWTRHNQIISLLDILQASVSHWQSRCPL